jgi:hypothetical protein
MYVHQWRAIWVISIYAHRLITLLFFFGIQTFEICCQGRDNNGFLECVYVVFFIIHNWWTIIDQFKKNKDNNKEILADVNAIRISYRL